MSYVQPDGKLRILANVPLDTTYDHTIYWNKTAGAGGATAQRDYFLSKTKGYGTAAVSKYTLDDQSYQRVKRGYLRVGIQADDLYDCNYLMFQNTHFGSKWFYAFIKSVDYINNEVSEIEYEVDVMQTWHFEYEPEECFVEREHTATDVIGENTVPENLEIGDYLFLDAGKTFNNTRADSDFSICVCSTWTRSKVLGNWGTPDDAPQGFYNGIYSGLHYNIFPLNGTDLELMELQGYLSGLEEKRKEEVVAIFMMPNSIISEWNPLPNPSSGGNVISRQKHISWSGGDPTKYEPTNKKLYTYPYNTLYVTSSDGDSAYFKYELFKTNSCSFYLEGAMGAPPEMGLTPCEYAFDSGVGSTIEMEVATAITTESFYVEVIYSGDLNLLVGRRVTVGSSGSLHTISKVNTEDNTIYIFPALSNISAGTKIRTADKPNYNYTLSVKNFQMCSWTTDSFKAWLAQNTTRLLGGVATTVAGAIATGGVINAAATSSPWMTKAIAEAREKSNAISAGSSIANSLLQVIPAVMQPDHAHGVSKGMLGMANGEFGYHFYYARIKDEFARIIDDYFTRFGYAVKRNKKPNRNARPHWTYCKTLGCTITASIPAPDAKAICDIYNNGITFWNNASEIGRYSELDNSPSTPTP